MISTINRLFNKKKIIDLLDKKTNKVVYDFDKTKESYLFFITKNNDTFIFKHYIIQKVNEYYIIKNRATNAVMYQDLVLFEAAAAIIECMYKNKYEKIREIINCEEKFYKHYLDMIIHHARYKEYIKVDKEKALISYDKLSNSHHLAEFYKNQIKIIRN